MAAKRTAGLIPLCHPLPLSGIDVTLAARRDGYAIEARVRTLAQTGVEMEALTAVSVAALTIYDMLKAADKSMVITDIELVSKRGGASGDYTRAASGGRQEAMISTLAQIPAHIAGKYSRDVFMRRCRADGSDAWSTAQLVEAVHALAAALLNLGVEAGDRVALMSDSRPEWVICDLATLEIGAVTVPIYPTLSPAQARYILEDSGARIAIVSDLVQAAKIQDVRHLLTALEVLVIIEPEGPGKAATAGGSVLAMSELIARGRDRLAADPSVRVALDTRIAAVAPGQLATIIYTSGTTGDAKGVMLTHDNIVSNVLGAAPILRKGPEDVALSFLPLSHGFERTVVFSYLTDGVTVVFAESIDTLARDLPATAPTLMTAVPRVFEKLHSAHPRDRAAGPRRAPYAVSLGVAPRTGPRPRGTARPGVVRAFRLAGHARRPSRVLAYPVAPRRADANAHVGERAAADRYRRVLRCGRPADSRGLRSHRDVTDPDRKPVRMPRGSARWGRPSIASSCALPRTARFSPAARTSCKATGASRPRRRRRLPAAGSIPVISARSAPTAI